MIYNEKFLKIYRGELKGKKVTDQEVERVVDRLDLYERVYHEHKSVKSILRQSGMTKDEMRDFLLNAKKHKQRIKRLKKTSITVKEVTTSAILTELEEKRDLFLRRMYLGDSNIEAMRELWIPYRSSVIQHYKNVLHKEGYVIKDMKILYAIREDVEQNSYCLDMLIEKYTDFSRERLKKNLQAQDIQFRENVDREKIKIVS